MAGNVLDALRTGSTPLATPAAAPQPANTNPLDALRAGHASVAPENPVQHAFGAVGKAAVLGPLSAVDAVLGAPERAVEGTVAGMTRAKGNVLGALGHGVYETFHPHDTKTRNENLGMAEQSMGMGPRDTGTGIGSGVHNFVRDTAAQTLLDPLSYLPFIGEGRLVENAAVRGAHAFNNALPAAARGVVRKTGDFFKANPEMDAALGKKGALIYHGIYRSERGKMGAQANADAKLLQDNRKAIEAGQVPTAVKSRLLQEPYDHGTQKMRERAVQIAHDQGVPLNEHNKPPTGQLNYPVREDYDELMTHTNRSPEQHAPVEAKPQAPFSRIEPKSTSVAGFEKARESLGEEDTGNLMQRLDARLAKGRNVVFERSVDDRLMDELLKHNAAGPLSGQLLKDPERYHALRAQGVTQGVKIAGIPALQKLADAYKTALFVNPLPHMFNIARLTYLAGGAPAVAKGIAHFARGGPQGELRQRLEEHTGLPEYLSGAAPKFADVIPGVRALRTYGQGKLSKFDASMRAGYLQELDNALGKGTDKSLQEYAKGREVSNAIGGYDETSPVVEAIRAAGGPFAQWRLGIVPRAVGTAALRAPHRVERYARGADTLNQDTGQNIEFGGPEEDAARLIQSPKSAARYLLSPSTIGAVPAGLVSAAEGQKQDVLKAVEQGARSYVPGAGIAEELAHLSPYSEGPNTAENTALGLVGGYTSGNLSSIQKRQQTAIDKTFDAQIKANMAKGDFRGAWDKYYQKKKALRALMMQ